MRIVIGLLFTLSIVSFGIGYFLLSPYYNCGYSIFCSNLLDKSFALYFGTGSLAIVFAALFFSPLAFKSWQKFALWFLPFAVDVFVTYTGPGRGYIDVTPDAVIVFKWFASFYIIVSLAIILISYLHKKYGKEKPAKVSSKKQKIIFWSMWSLYIVILIGMHFLIR